MLGYVADTLRQQVAPHSNRDRSLFQAPCFDETVGTRREFFEFLDDFCFGGGICFRQFRFHVGVIFPPLSSSTDFFFAFANRHLLTPYLFQTLPH